MKTLEEFIQRLQNDAAFEKRAQSFDHGDDLIAFVKSEGYDFTLEQLMTEFESEEKPPAETGDPAPAPVGVSAPPPSRPDQAAFPRQLEAWPRPLRGTGLQEGRNDALPGEPAAEKLAQPQAPMPPPEPEDEPRAGLFKGGGGRHRGFSAQRLKSLAEEDP